MMFTNGEDSRLMLGEAGAPSQPAGDRTKVGPVPWVDDSHILFVVHSGAKVDLRLRELS